MQKYQIFRLIFDFLSVSQPLKTSTINFLVKALYFKIQFKDIFSSRIPSVGLFLGFSLLEVRGTLEKFGDGRTGRNKGIIFCKGEREFPFPVIPGNTGLQFPFPKFAVPVPKVKKSFPLIPDKYVKLVVLCSSKYVEEKLLKAK